MAPSDSEDDNLEDLEYDGDDDPDADVDDDALDGGADDATEEADDVCFSDWDFKLALTAILPCRRQDFRIGGLGRWI
jgi:hypothetical protein